MSKKLQVFAAAAGVLLLGAMAPVARAANQGTISSGETRNWSSANATDTLTFVAAAGDVVNVKGALADNTRVNVAVLNPGGGTVLSTGCSASNNGSASFSAAAAGTYTLSLSPCRGYSGGFYATFLNLTTGPLRASGDPAQEGGRIASGQTVQGYTTPADLDAFQIRGEPGERLVLSMSKLGAGPNPLLWLFPPAGAPAPATNLFSGLGDRQEAPLDQAGTYTIVTQSEDTNKVGNFNLTAQKLPGAAADCYSTLQDADGGIIPAAPTATGVPGSIAYQSGLDAWQFYATAGQTATVTMSREMRVSVYAPPAVSSQRAYGAPAYEYSVCNPTTPLTTHDVALPTTGYYELLVEECTVARTGAYTLDLTLPAQTTPPPLANPAPAACANITNAFATDTFGWDPLAGTLEYGVSLQEVPLGPIAPLGTLAPPPSGRPVYPLPYQQLQTGTIYNWHVSAWEGAEWTHSPTFSFRLNCTAAVTVAPSTLDFGDLLVGTTSAPVTVTITNTGTCYEDPRVGNVPAGFTVSSDTCTPAPEGGHLAPGGSCSFAVTFAPASEGPYAGGLALAGFLPEAHDGIVDLAGEGVLADLQVVQVSDPAQPNPDGTFSFTDTTRNAGVVPVPASVTSYRLSLDLKVTRLDPTFDQTRAVPALTTNPDPGHVSTGTVTLTIPADTPRGTYYVAACADATALFGETSEANNCRLSKTTIKVESDLLVTAVSDPPAGGSPGASFAVTDTTRNSGLAAAAASRTAYRLSLDRTITTTDPLLTGSRSVAALGIGIDSTGSATVTVPAAVPQGTYYLGACADDGRATEEASETNNCSVSTTTITLVRADLTVTAVGDPPPAGVAGDTFSATDTTLNGGEAAAAASTTGYRLSLDTAITTSDPLLAAARTVPSLAIGGSSSGSVTLTIPANMAPGTYYLAACADSGSKVSETLETNNCLRSTGRITLSVPDLQVTAVSPPPASGVVGTSFPVTDTTANASASVAAMASVTRYRLSLDAVVNTADPLLSGTRAVPALGAGAGSSGTVTVTLPPSVAPGAYYLAACADDQSAVAEASETNNCKLSATKLVLQKPDLTVTAVSNPPAAGLVGDSFPVSDTTANGGATAAGASTTRYRLSLDAVVDASDPLLGGGRAVAGLAPGADSAGSGTVVTIPATLPQGTFYLGACADAEGTVNEINEGNNCRASATRITITKPDLLAVAISEPPEEGDLGQSFDVTDTTSNFGLVPAGASTTRYFLSLDTTVGGGDPLLTGTRAVPALAAGATSTGTVTVTVPTTVAQGSYYLAACADGTAAVPESNELNNCVVSVATLDIINPDLRVTAVSDPPAEGFVGASFSVTDTTANTGSALAGKATTTRYRLSADVDITSADLLLTGTRAVGVLAAGAASSGTVSVSIPAKIAQGVYHLAACADDTAALTESNEKNNCRVAAGTILIKKPDLQVTALSEPPPEGFVGGSFPVTDTTENKGIAPAGASTTRYRLSLDRTITTSDPQLAESRTVGPLAAGAGSGGTVTVNITAAIPQGVYYLAACADDAAAVSESDDANNCRLSDGTISLKRPDLWVTAVSGQPAVVTLGATFAVTDTTENKGIAAAAASTTRYRLSTDTAITTSDPLLTGTRAAGALGIGAAATGTVTVTVPGTLSDGTYYFAACADDDGKVVESDEKNNCLVAAGTVELRKPDLRISALSPPPAVGNPGFGFSVTDTTENAGAAAAADTTTRYRLSLDATITAADPLLNGTRAVGGLAAGASSVGTVTVTIPGSIAEGTYYLGACADDAAAVSETNEANNCAASASTISLRKPDLLVTAVSSPPPAGAIGDVFVVTDTTMNAGAAAAPASTTRYRISPDAVISSADMLLTEVTVKHLVPALNPGESGSDSISVTIPTVAQGLYYIGACADEGNVAAESVETNNCLTAAGQIMVNRADLTITAVSDPPATVNPGTSFGVTTTVANGGLAAAKATTTRFRLSLDTTVTAADPLLTGTQAVGALDAGAASTGAVTVTVPASVAPGTYHFAACADDTAAVPESSETNNCTLAAAQVQMRKADLRATAVSDPPALSVPGASFPVTDTTENLDTALATAGASTTRYRLSADAVITTADMFLGGARAVDALAVGQGSTGTVTVTLPANMADGTYYFAACADTGSVVTESDENNNCVVAAATIDLWKPDLAIRALSSPPADATAGYGSFDVTATTGNLSTRMAATVPTITRFYLSADETLTGADPQLAGERGVPALAAGADFVETGAVAVPSTVAEGAYWLYACADATSQVAESNESNCVHAATQVRVWRPDLAYALQAGVPSVIAPGQALTVSGTVTNAGGGTAGQSTTYFYLSTDATITSGDRLLTGSLSSPAIDPGQSHAAPAAVSATTAVPSGTYYFGACADALSAVTEQNEGNNCSVWGATVLVRRPDLTVTSITDPPATRMAGESFSLTETTRNDGVVAAGTSTTRYYLSLYPSVSVADPALALTRAVPALDPGADSTGTVTVTVPAGTTPNLYYLAACADGVGALGEENEVNNCLVASSRIDVRQARPDLVVASISAPPATAEANTTFSITDQTRNASSIIGASASTTAYVLSADTTVDATDARMTPARSVPSLPLNGAHTGTVTATIPAAVAPGVYYLAACADDPGAVIEAVETNNCTFAASTIQVTPAMPDLTVTTVSFSPATVNAGGTFLASHGVRNAGAAGAAASETRFSLSTDRIVGGDLPLSPAMAVPYLGVGVTLSGGVNVTVPAGTAGGSYYLIACADEAGAVNERSETNNCLASSNPIVVPTRPDLTLAVIEGARIDWFLSPGEVFDERVTVTNGGNGAAAASTSRFYLTADTTVGAGDFLLAGTLVSGALAAGASDADRMVPLTVPTSPPVPEGTYYLAGCADNLGVVAESSETNNCGLGGTFDVRWAALGVTALANPPASVVRGSTIGVTDTTANTALLGGDAAPFVNSYYLSVDVTIGGGDLVLAGNRAISGLAAGNESSGTVTVTVPLGTAPGTYFLGVCADTGNAVPEASETNCRASTTTIQVQ